jgi:hypothetical protein
LEEKKIKNSKIYATLLLLLLLGLISFSPAIALLSNTVLIKSQGTISTTQITARSGFPDDIQAAVNVVAAAGGGTVYVPEGNWTFNPSSWPGVTIPNGVNVIGAGIGQTVLYLPNYPQGGLANKPFPNRPFFYCTGNYETNKKVRISGITFQGHVEDEEEILCGVEVNGIDNFRIDHCEFIDFDNAAIFPRDCRGVIDHCIIDNPYKDRIGGTEGAYGIIVLGDYTVWYSLDQLLGKYTLNTVYIEDCNFSRCRHSIASNQAGWYVVRHCTFQKPRPVQYPMIDVHGASPGGRGLEAYNNTIIGSLYEGSSISVGVDFRGGGGVVFNNTFIDCAYGVKLSVEAPEPYQPYNIWIWNNQMTKQNAPNEGTLLLNTGDYKEGVDYFLYAKPDYAPYPYPHPLTLS